MRIRIRVADANGWSTFVGDAPDGSDLECYALPKIKGEAQCRAVFWTRKLGFKVPAGRGMIWEVEPPYDADDDVTKSFECAYRAIRERKAAGGPGWEPKP